MSLLRRPTSVKRRDLSTPVMNSNSLFNSVPIQPLATDQQFSVEEDRVSAQHYVRPTVTVEGLPPLITLLKEGGDEERQRIATELNLHLSSLNDLPGALKNLGYVQDQTDDSWVFTLSSNPVLPVFPEEEAVLERLEPLVLTANKQVMKEEIIPNNIPGTGYSLRKGATNLVKPQQQQQTVLRPQPSPQQQPTLRPQQPLTSIQQQQQPTLRPRVPPSQRQQPLLGSQPSQQQPAIRSQQQPLLRPRGNITTPSLSRVNQSSQPLSRVTRVNQPSQPESFDNPSSIQVDGQLSKMQPITGGTKIITLPKDSRTKGMGNRYREYYTMLNLPPPTTNLGYKMYEELTKYLTEKGYVKEQQGDNYIYRITEVYGIEKTRNTEVGMAPKESEQIRVSSNNVLEQFGFTPIDIDCVKSSPFCPSNITDLSLIEPWTNLIYFPGVVHPGFESERVRDPVTKEMYYVDGPFYIDMEGNLYQKAKVSNLQNWWESSKVYQYHINDSNVSKSFFERRAQTLASTTLIPATSKSTPVTYYFGGKFINPQEVNPRIFFTTTYIQIVRALPEYEQLYERVREGERFVIIGRGANDIGELTQQKIDARFNDQTKSFGPEFILACMLSGILPSSVKLDEE